MTVREATSRKWMGVPTSQAQAQEALLKPPCSKCAVCNSNMVIAILRPPMTDWRIHCNHCGSEVGFHVVLQRAAWRKIAAYHNHP
jgi:hypothetical protein